MEISRKNISGEGDWLEELKAKCPETYWEGNEWSQHIKAVFMFGGENTHHWQWKHPEQETRIRQLRMLKAVLTSNKMSMEDKEAVGGWLLSQMLTVPPSTYEPITFP